MTHFCPRCHRQIVRVVSLGPGPTPCGESLLVMDDTEIEEFVQLQHRDMVRVLIAPTWRAAITTDRHSMHNVSFGCPYCPGKVTLFKH